MLFQRDIFSQPALAGFFFIFIGSVFAQSPQENYVLSKTYKIETTNSIPGVGASQAAVSIRYFDGLGRSKQEVAHRMAGNGGDLVTHISYDALGRPVKEYLPLVRAASLNLEDNVPSQTEAYYSDTAPYSETVYENSALGRVLKQRGPGGAWQNSDRAIHYNYETNSANDIHHYSVNLSGSSPALNYHQKYPEGQLRRSITKNENWKPADGKRNTTEEYKNKMGQVVLRRHYNASDASGVLPDPNVDVLDTYYVYDIYGNLTFVLPPKLSAQIPTGGIPSQTLMTALAYQYTYDHRNRMSEKKLPGKKKETIKYDVLDRVISTGPVPSPFGANTEGRLHTKYDRFNRVVYTLWKEGFGAMTPFGAEPQAPVSESRISGTTTIGGVELSYSNNVQPTSGDILSVHYYDDYTYKDAPSPVPSGVGEGNGIGIKYNNSIKPTGLPTGSWTRLLETPSQKQGVKNYTLYDSLARPARVATLSPDNGKTVTDTDFNFIGDPIYTLTTHKKNASADELKIKETYTYNSQSRLTMLRHQINNKPPRILAANSYDDLGRILRKKVGGTGILNADELQIVDYNYNIRGWLTQINNVDNLNQPGGGPVDLFAFKINYHTVIDDINGQVKELYNGNIAETYWRTATDNIKRKYGYSYDNLNRITAAYYQLPGTITPRADSYSSSYSYDENGNILSLKRNGMEDSATTIIEIDDLDYTYDQGNRLLKVKDASNHPAGFNRNGAGSNTQYTYDDFGNLKTDPYKKITNITYNHLNLPVKVTFQGGETIEYTYLADGTKIKKTAKDTQNTTTTTEYREGFQYKNSILEFFPTSEGYVKAVAETLGPNPEYSFQYVFTYTDHLGNIRMKYTTDPQTGATTILQEDHYYPYGLTHQGYNGNHKMFVLDPTETITIVPVTPDLSDPHKYKFGGKELQSEFGIGVYDFGARMYMPDIGRWGVMDNLSELYFSHSSYVYALNTPVQAIDPDGNIVIFINGMHTGDGGKPDYWRTYRTELYTYSTNNWTYNATRRVETSAFDTAVMNHLGDNNALYRDGAMGGLRNTLWETNRSKINLSASKRINGGYEQGKKDAAMIIANLRDKTTGEIVETIKIITHSMGAAYGKGYVKALKEYIRTLPKDQQRQIRITLVADFDPYQAGKLSADPNVHTQQFTHLGGFWGLAEERQKGLNDENYYEADGSHSIFTFFNNIQNLHEGTYEWNGEEWKCITCD